MLDNDEIMDLVEQFKEQSKARDKRRNSKLRQIDDKMREQIERETQEFELVDNPTGKQKFEQGCRLGMLLMLNCGSVIDLFIKDFTAPQIEEDGTAVNKKFGHLAVKLSTVTLFYKRHLFFWNKLNVLADNVRIVYDDGEDGGMQSIELIYIFDDIGE